MSMFLCTYVFRYRAEAPLYKVFNLTLIHCLFRSETTHLSTFSSFTAGSGVILTGYGFQEN